MIEPAYQNLAKEPTQDDWSALYYQETSQIDIALYHQMSWQVAVWSQLSAIQPYDSGSLLTADEIGKWRDFVLGWYEGEQHEWQVEPIYITHAKTLGFIDQASVEIKGIFKDWKSSTGIDPGEKS